MECRKFRRMISREIDGEIEGAERAELDRHCASCAGCREFREACLVGFSIHRSVRDAGAPPSLLPSILAAVEGRPHRGWVPAWATFALPAAAVGAAILGFWIGGLMHESYNPAATEKHTDVLELKYLDEYPPGSFGDILTASYEGGGDEQR